MAAFNPALKKTLGFEGGYSDHPSDTGGKTSYGITEAVARQWGYHGEMKDLPLDVAEQIYHRNYWTPLKLDGFSDQLVAEYAFDIAVNMGIGTAGRLLQETVNFLDGNGTLFVDGKVGVATVSKVNEISKSNRAGAFLKLFKAVRIMKYVNIVLSNPAQKVFLTGWINRA